MSHDNLLELLSMLKEDNINYYLITLEPLKTEGTKVNIYTSLEEEETKSLIKVIKEELKKKKNE